MLSQGGEWGWRSGETVLLATVGALSLALWLPWELRTRDPLIDVRLAARRPVLLTNLASFVIALGLLANLLLASLQFGTPTSVPGGLGLSPAAAGLAMAVPASLFVFLSPVLGMLLRRIGGRNVLLMGAGTMSAAYVARVFLDGSVVQVTFGSVLIGVGSTLSLAAMPMIIMASVPRTRTASANGVNSLCRLLGTSSSTAGLAALTSATAVTVAGHDFPSLETVHIACWTLAGAGALAIDPRAVRAAGALLTAMPWCRRALT